MRRIAIQVQGIVQGVGFRPFVYRLASRLGLTGSVRNDSSGVYIEIQGAAEKTGEFIDTLSTQPPPLARITSFEQQEAPLKTENTFRIISSAETAGRQTLISPDIATCPDCLNELLNSADRRYHYPFINCTNCGPRYTIIADIPYDRKYTTMSDFEMCASCQAEYDNPDDRRFHAQPNACPECGPEVSFMDVNGQQISNRDFSAVAAALRRGDIIAIKGLGGYHLAVDATNHDAVVKLRQRKHRFEKPLALMAADLQKLQDIAEIDPHSKELLQSLHRPIVLCRKKMNSPISSQVSPDNEWLGLMLPYTPLHELLFHHTGLPYLVMTSANLSEEPICYTNEESFKRMKTIADGFLNHNRQINIRCDDSVVRVYNGETHFIRRSRGYAPRPVILKHSGVSVLAVGAQLKNTICLTRKNFAFLSQHIGDLENTLTLDVFEQTITHLQRLNEIKPAAIVHDLHPDYLSTRWAKEQTEYVISGVQHHYAHILSVMAEYGINEKVIGVALDGTGYGPDGKIWGGEILTCDAHSFQRSAHIGNVPLPGGDKAVNEPWRMAVSYMLSAGENVTETGQLLFPGREREQKIVMQMIEKNINCPQTSSCGRLFDAVSAILGLREAVAYEGQAAVMLEAAAGRADWRKVPDFGFFNIRQNGEIMEIGPENVVRDIIRSRLDGAGAAELSLAFHNSLSASLCEVVSRLRDKEKIHKVVLSGGCFQNMLLRAGMQDRLMRDGFKVYFNREVPANDGGIALGQAFWGIMNCLSAKGNKN